MEKGSAIELLLKPIVFPYLFSTILLLGCDLSSENEKGISNGPDVFLWVSTQTTDGNMGGVEGADEICEEDAPEELSQLEHRAVLRSSDRYEPDGKSVAKRPDGTVIVEDYTDFFTAEEKLEASVNDRTQTYWFGLRADNNCGDWTSNNVSESATAGRSNQVGSGRYEYGLRVKTYPCNQSLHVLCSSF